VEAKIMSQESSSSTFSQVDHTTLPIVPAGEHLIEHEVYIDTVLKGHGPFRALAGQVAGSGNGYVAEQSVDPALWDLLVREDGEAKLLQQVESGEEELPEGHISELGAAV
jgi:hypothetical protein